MPKNAHPGTPAGPAADGAEVDPFPDWFTAFLHDRQTRKPSAHTMKAYRQDFVAIAGLVTDNDPASMNITDITKDSMRAVVERARSVPDERWNELPIEYLLVGAPLEANEETLKQKSIDKVTSGAEPFREGYVVKLWRDRKGKLHIVDGHHRVAMYHVLIKPIPVRIMDSATYDRLTEQGG